MAKYTTYASHKVTAITGLENIPEHWEIKQVRYLLLNGQDGIKIGPFGSALKLEDMVEAGYKVYGQENVIKKDFSLGKRWISENKFKAMQVYRVYSGDILITMMGTSGKCEIVPDDYQTGIIDSHLIRLGLQKDKMLPKFFKVLIDGTLEIEYQVKIQGKGSIMHGLNSSIIKSLELPIPPILEQEDILSFLDHETAQIDTLIKKQKTLIQLLKEKRQAVISHAVTKGLNPDAPMKDSGVEWLGEVPEHWEYLKFDYVVNSVGDIDHYMPKSVDSGVPYLMTGDLKDLVSDIDFDRCKQVDNKSYIQLSRKTKTMKGNLILARYATIGTVSYVDIEKEFLVSYACVTIDPNTEIVLGKYLYWYLKSQAFADAIKRYINSNTQGNVGVDSLKRVKLVVPTLKEQESIITYIEDMTSRFDTLNKKAEQAIQLMQERRTALISAAVTGKIDVRSWSK